MKQLAMIFKEYKIISMDQLEERLKYLEVLEVAFTLACSTLSNIYFNVYKNEEEYDFEEFFKDEAKKELGVK